MDKCRKKRTTGTVHSKKKKNEKTKYHVLCWRIIKKSLKDFSDKVINKANQSLTTLTFK